jgi:protocatechuate 3,4-dioxygenase beta subunit
MRRWFTDQDDQPRSGQRSGSDTLHEDRPRSPQKSRRRFLSALSAISAVAFRVLVFAVVGTTAIAQQPGFPSQAPGFPQMPAPGGRPQQPNAAADQPPGTATLRGHVYDAASGQPLRKAQVRIVQQMDAPAGPVFVGGRENRMATTDAQGAYEFKEVRAGRYTLMANKGSFVSMQYGQTRPTEPGKPIQILDNQTIERVDFSLPHGGIITGRILDEYGEPLSDVMVAPQRFQYVQGQRRLTAAGRTVNTDDLGEFRIFGVPPGQYYLQATWRGENFMGPPNPNEQRTSYAPLFFPGTLEVSQAQRLTVGVGSEISDVVMTMKPVKAVRVSGTIVDSLGRPMNGMLMISQSFPFGFMTGSPVRPDGTFTLTSLAPGEYTITAQQMGNPESEVATTKLTVGSEDITGVQLVGAKPVAVRGRVLVDPAAASSLPPRLMLQAFPAQMMPMFGPRVPAAVQDDMTFELKSPPGLYRLNLMPAGMGWAIRSVRLSATDVTDSGFEIKTNEEISGLEVELTNKLTTIAGLVTNARGAAVKDYTTIVFAQDSARWTGNTRYQGSGRPDQDGRFKISGLPAGEYYIIALDRLESGEAGDPEFLERIRTKASRLSLNEGETKTIDLRVNSASQP